MDQIDILIRLLLASTFGGVMGYSREKVGKAAGLRTHILVCMGAALFTIVSIQMAQLYPGGDAGRIASSIVVGIGFIGAGAIIQSGEAVRGVTTAASIWVAAAIGMAVGAGMFLIGLFAVVIAWFVLAVFPEIEKRFIRS